jgi:hypothetical protein
VGAPRKVPASGRSILERGQAGQYRPISSNSPSLNGYSGTSIGGKMSKSKQLRTRQISSLENWHLTHLINEESGLCELGYRAAPICRGDFGFQSSDPATRPNFSPSICCGRCNRTDIRQTRGELPPADLSTGTRPWHLAQPGLWPGFLGIAQCKSLRSMAPISPPARNAF